MNIHLPAISEGQFLGSKSHMLHVWYIYLQNWVIFGANVGKYTIHGAYGMV